MCRFDFQDDGEKTQKKFQRCHIGNVTDEKEAEISHYGLFISYNTCSF